MNVVDDGNIHRIQDTEGLGPGRRRRSDRLFVKRAKVRTNVRSRKWRKALAVVGHFPGIMFPVFRLGRRPPVEASGSRGIRGVSGEANRQRRPCRELENTDDECS